MKNNFIQPKRAKIVLTCFWWNEKFFAHQYLIFFLYFGRQIFLACRTENIMTVFFLSATKTVVAIKVTFIRTLHHVWSSFKPEDMGMLGRKVSRHNQHIQLYHITYMSSWRSG
jgi:hypothetical protein